jgi:uncharacterized protein YciI
MYFIIRAYDKKESLDLRMSVRSDHLAYAKNSGMIVLAGPFLTAGDDPKPCGSMLIIRADTQAAADEFAKNDPYAIAGLFEKRVVSPWMPAAGEWKPEDA